MTRFGGGNKGYVFLLENKAGGRQVVKFQAEDPREALIGTHVMQHAKGVTPHVSSASDEALTHLAGGVGELPSTEPTVAPSAPVSSSATQLPPVATTAVPADSPATTKEPAVETATATATATAMATTSKRAMLAALRDKGAAHKESEQDLPAAREHFLQLAQRKGDHKHALVMDFAEGQTIKKVMETNPAAFVDAVRRKKFQESFGRILAGDTFSGNPDRAMAVLSQGTPTGWYHEENMFIRGAGKKAEAVAIDNAFKPGLPAGVAPYGVNARGAQIAGATAGSDKILAEHADLVYSRMIAQLNSLGRPREGKPDTDQHRGFRDAAVEAEKHRKKFVANVVSGGSSAMGQLLKRGQGWKHQFAERGATKDDLAQHRMRTRYIRMLRAGVDPKVAEQHMSDQKKYREWVLQREKKIKEPGKAAEIVAQGDDAYRAAKFR